MKVIHIDAAEGCDIIIGDGVIKSIGKTLRSNERTAEAKRCLIVADESSANSFGDLVSVSLKKAGYDTEIFVQSEMRRKSLACAEPVCSAAASAHLGRDDVMLSLGGADICDITGFASSIYRRGINCIHVPTTLIAQADVAIGGKSELDLPEGKNIIGTYYHPVAVVCDVDTLRTQTEQEWRNGAAEIIKFACVASDKFFEEVMQGGIKQNAEEIISKAVAIKAKGIAKDEFDRGARRLFDFGHTLGHAIELRGKGRVRHGEAVAVGMHITARAGENAGITKQGTADKIKEALFANGLPAEARITADALFEAMALDKKSDDQNVDIVLLKKIGEAMVHKIKASEIKDFFSVDFS